MIIRRLRMHVMRNHFFYNILIICFTGTAILMVLNYRTLQAEFVSTLAQQEERAAWSQLEVFGGQTDVVVSQYFQQGLNVISNLSAHPNFIQALQTNIPSATQTLHDQQGLNNNFETITVLDKTGKIVTLSNISESARAIVGNDVSTQKYYQETIASKKPYISNSFLSSGLDQHQLIAITSPIFINDELQYILIGYMKVGDLTKQIHLSSNFVDFQATLTDGAGNVIIKNGQALADAPSLKDKDPVLDKLLAGNSPNVEQGITPDNIPAFTRGEKISIGNAGTFYLLTFYPSSQLDAQKYELQDEANSVGLFIISRDLFVFLIAVVILREYIARNAHL
jgi:hypothetical protein